jgi:hypothetical protein
VKNIMAYSMLEGNYSAKMTEINLLKHCKNRELGWRILFYKGCNGNDTT